MTASKTDPAVSAGPAVDTGTAGRRSRRQVRIDAGLAVTTATAVHPAEDAPAPDPSRGGHSPAAFADLMVAPMCGELWQCSDYALDAYLDDELAWRSCLEVVEIRLLAEQVRRRSAVTGLARRAAVNRVGDGFAYARTLTVDQARRRVWFAAAIDDRPATLAAYAYGEASYAQAVKLLTLIDAIPEGPAAAATADHCEDALLKAARISDGVGGAFGRARSKLADALDPDGPAPAADTKRNELTVARMFNGRYRLRGDLDAASAESLYTALSPLSAPRPEDDGTRDRRGAARRRADGLAEVLRRYLAGTGPDEPVAGTGGGAAAPPGAAPSGEAAPAGTASPGSAAASSGCAAPPGGYARPQVHVHIRARDLAALPDADTARRLLEAGRIRELFAAVGAGWADHTGTITAGQARALACDGAITPVITDDAGVPLNLGRTARLASRGQRRALAARDRGCAFPGCGRPAAWTIAHHIVHWVDGGRTDLDNLVLLCQAHHHAVHDDGWHVAMGTDRRPVFQPPAHVDPLGRWGTPDGLHTPPPPG